MYTFVHVLATNSPLALVLQSAFRVLFSRHLACSLSCRRRIIIVISSVCIYESRCRRRRHVFFFLSFVVINVVYINTPQFCLVFSFYIEFSVLSIFHSVFIVVKCAKRRRRFTKTVLIYHPCYISIYLSIYKEKYIQILFLLFFSSAVPVWFALLFSVLSSLFFHTVYFAERIQEKNIFSFNFLCEFSRSLTLDPICVCMWARVCECVGKSVHSVSAFYCVVWLTLAFEFETIFWKHHSLVKERNWTAERERQAPK